MTDIQEKLLEMFSWFHLFCVEHGLKYYALGGTLLGAVRHKGFIPWDDDIDIGLPRDDYDKLIAIMSEMSDSKYLLESPLKNKDFVYPYCKLYDTTTTLIENTRYKTKRGIYLDIFPLDGIGNTKEESIKNFKKIDAKNNYVLTKTCALRKGRSFLKNATIVISRCLPFPSWRNVQKKLDMQCRKRAFDDYKYAANLYGNWHEREIFKRAWFGDDPRLLNFENINIYAPQDYDSYLSAIYGDYMKLPPVDKQVTHHDYLYLDLNSSYLF